MIEKRVQPLKEEARSTELPLIEVGELNEQRPKPATQQVHHTQEILQSTLDVD
jgi:hypothetical protein